MLGKKHLHIDEYDQLSDLIVRTLYSAKSGNVTVAFGDEPAAKISMKDRTINVNIVHPDIFRVRQDGTGLMDKLKTASEFGRKLSDNDLTIAFLRDGKEAIRLGKAARPTLSKVITRSNDVQLTSVGTFAKLKRDLKTD
jgi:hypothetical protein